MATPRTHLRRLRRAIGLLLGVMVVLVLLVFLGLAIRPIREAALNRALGEASKALPGELSVEASRWTALELLELDGLLWVQGGDTLVSLDYLRLEPELRSLLHRDVHLRVLKVSAVQVDLGAIRTAFPDEESPGNDTGSAGGAASPFPRAGSVPGLPSIGIDRLQIGLERVLLPDSLSFQADLDLKVDARREETPELEASIVLRQTGHAPLTLEAGTRDAESWGLSIRAVDSPPILDMALLADPQDSSHFERVRLDLRFEMPTKEIASTIPFLDSLVVGIPELEGAALRLEGPLSIEGSSPELDLALELHDWPIVRHARGSLSWRDAAGAFHLEVLEAGGLVGELRVEGPDPGVRAEIDLDVPAGLKLQPYLDSAALPDDLSAQLAAQLEFNRETGEFTAQAQSTVSATSRRLDELELHVDAAGTLPSASAELRILSRSGDLGLDWSLHAQYADSLTAQFSPIHVRVDTLRLGVPPAPPIDASSRAHYNLETQELRVKALRVQGDAGEGRVDLTLSKQRPMRLALDWEWATVPGILQLLEQSSALEDSLRDALWQQDGGYHLHLDLQERAAATQRFELALEAKLPAPWRLLSDLTPEHRSWGQPLELKASASGSVDSVSVLLSAEENEWLKSMHLRLRHESTRSVLDSLTLRLEGLLLQASGERAGSELLGQVDLAIHNDLLLQELLESSFPEASSRLSAHLEVSGSVDSLDAGLLLGAEFQSSEARVDSLSVVAQVTGSQLSSARLWAQGLTYQRFQMDQMSLQWQAESAELFPGLAALEVHGPGLDLLQIARVERDSVWTVEVDTLGIRLGEEELQSQRPFRIRALPEAQAFLVEGMELSGSLGEMSSDLHYGPRVKQGTLELHLQLPPSPPALGVPEGAWPEELDLSLAIDEKHVEGLLSADGMGLGTRRDLHFELQAQSDADSIYVEFELGDPDRSLASGRAWIPLGYLPEGPSWEPRPGHPSLFMIVQELPLPARFGDQKAIEDYFLGRGQEHAPVLQARIDVEESEGQPHGALQARVSFESIPELSNDALEFAAVWMAADDPPLPSRGNEELDELLNQAREEVDDTGIGLRAVWETDGTPALWIGAFSPVLWDADKGGIDWDDKEMRVGLRSAQIRLEDFNRFLPDRIRLGGFLDAELSGQGVLEEMKLEGSLTGQDLSFADPGRAEATANLEFQFSGTTKAPVIRGTVILEQGTMRIPESRKSLHDAQGRSLLWEAAAQTAAQDSTRRPFYGRPSAAATMDSVEYQPLLPVATDMSVELSIPRKLWIRGRGLDVRLNGDLKMTQEEGKPIVEGRLETTEGRFSFMSKTFRARRGQVDFFGDPTDPSLDIELNTRVADVEIFVNVRGTAQKPELELRSDPYMEESDIMSYLLFGGPSASLNQAGSDLLNQQAINALEGFAIPALEGGVGSELGISMIQLRHNEEADKGMNIMVGSYITPVILLRYEMSLEDSQDYTVNLEYWINRRLSLRTYYSQARESGMEINWSKDY